MMKSLPVPCILQNERCCFDIIEQCIIIRASLAIGNNLHQMRGLAVFLCLPIAMLAVNYTQFMTPTAASSLYSVVILEYLGKQCRPYNRAANPNACSDYCKHFYAYAPGLPYSNAKFFNLTTKLCQPQPVCPTAIFINYDPVLNKCMDRISGLPIASLNSTLNLSTQTVAYRFNCLNGKMTTFNGLIDCECNFGYTSSLNPANSSGTPTLMKCDQVVSLENYLPDFLQIYYDPSMDNPFPHPKDPAYWNLALIYYLKQLKSSVSQFFSPYTVQIVLVMIPQDSILNSTTDIVLLIWGCLLAVLLCVFSTYEKIMNTISSEEIQQEKIIQSAGA